MSSGAQAVILPDLGEADVEHPVEVGWKIYPFLERWLVRRFYVGKTINPEKAWWPEDGMLTLLGVWAEDHRAADVVAFRLEALAIRDAAPRFNIAGVVR